MKFKIRYGLVALIIFLFIFFHIYFHNTISIKMLQKNVDTLSWFNAHYPVVFTLLFILLFATIVFIGLPISPLITMLAGYLFGVMKAILISIMSVALGCLVLFLLVRYLIGNHIQEKLSHRLHNMYAEIKQNGIWYIIMFQLLPFSSNLLITLCAGMTTISWFIFTVSIVLGTLPGTIIYCIAGNHLHKVTKISDVMTVKMVALFLALGLLILLSLIVKHYWSKRGDASKE